MSAIHDPAKTRERPLILELMPALGILNLETFRTKEKPPAPREQGFVQVGALAPVLPSCTS